MIRPKLTRMGTFQLHEAVLDVLLENYPEGYGVGAAAISRRAGLYRDAGVVHMNDALVHGCLNELFDYGKVEQHNQPNGRGGWRLSGEEYARRRDDI